MGEVLFKAVFDEVEGDQVLGGEGVGVAHSYIVILFYCRDGIG